MRAWPVFMLIVLLAITACSSATATLPLAPTNTLPPHNTFTAVVPINTTTPILTQTEILQGGPTSTVAPLVASSNKMNWFDKFSIGVNFAGGEFGDNIPGVYNHDYIYPDCTYMEQYFKKGARLDRFPFKLERLIADQKLTPDISLLHTALNCAAQNQARLILDAHNYARIKENGIERLMTPQEMAQDWSVIAKEFKGDPGLAGYGIDNEPHDLSTPWKEYAQATITAIRQIDTETPLIIDGDSWSGAHSWNVNDDLASLQDPSNKLVFDGHQYYDSDSSGSYNCKGAQACGAKTGLAQERLSPFVSWCVKNSLKCIIGEMGVPVSDLGWKPVITEAYDYLRTNNIPVMIWAAGPWWGSYPLSLDNGGNWLFQVGQ